MMLDSTHDLFYLRLQAAHGVGAAAQRSILRYLLNHGLRLGEFLTLQPSGWYEAGLSKRQVDALISSEKIALEWEQQLQKMGIQIVGQLDKQYPGRLKSVLGDQAPPVLYCWGNTELFESPGVGFCGSRNTSQKGVEVASDTAEQVAREGWTVVSGHARGIDIVAHKIALQSGGSTIIVIPEGFFNFRLREEIRKLVNSRNTLVVSEFQPNSRWSVGNAMIRNQSICGLSDALVVVQAGTTGGTFEAGKFAQKVKVPLFVVEYDQPELNGPGNPFFLRQGAKRIMRDTSTRRANLEHLLDEVNSHYQSVKRRQRRAKNLETQIQGELFPKEEPF